MSAPSESEARTRDFFIYRERDGTPAVVDTLSRVPKYGEKSLRIITLPKQDDEEPFLDPGLLEQILAAPEHAVDEAAARLSETRQEIRTPEPASPPAASGLDPTSVLLGAALGFGAGAIGARFFRAPSWVFKIGLVLAAITLGGGVYYGWVRSQLGMGQGETIVHPGTIVDDARRAADAMDHRNTELERRLDATE